MKLTMLVGENENACFLKATSLLLEENKKLQNIFVVVPDKATLTTELELIDTLKTNGLLNIDVTTINRLSKMVLADFDNNSLSTVALLAVIKKIILQNAAKFKTYFKMAKSPGFAKEIYDTILQFKSSGITVNEIENSLFKMPFAIQNKMHDILIVYSEYEKFLKERILDEPGKIEAMVQNIKFCDKIKNAKFMFLKFDSLTNLNAKIVKELLKYSKGVFFAFCSGKGKGNEEIYLRNIYDKLNHISSELEIKPEINYAPSAFKNKSMKILNDELLSFSVNKNTHEMTKIELFEFSTAQEEVDAVAFDIYKKVRDENYNFSDFSVAVSELESYADLIKDTFKKYNISFNLDEKFKSENHFISRFIKTILRLFKTDFSAEYVLEISKNLLLKIPENESAFFENYVRKYAINKSQFLSDFKDENAEKTRRQITSILEPAYNTFKHSRTAEGYLNALNEVFLNAKVGEICKEYEENAQQTGDEKLAQIGKILLEKLENFTREIKSVLGGFEISYEEFFNIIETMLNETNVTIIPFYANSVYVFDAFNGATRKTKKLYILNACEKAFPQRKSDVGILLDEEIKGLQMQHSLEPSVSELNKRMLFKSFLLCTSSDELFMSYSENVNAETQRPSLIMLNIKNIFNAKIIKHEKQFYTATRTQSLEIFYDALNEIKKGTRIKESSNFYALAKVLKINLKENNKNINKTLADLSLLFKNEQTSISQLETFTSCPLKHFFAYVLRLRKNEKAEIENLEIGNILHRFVYLMQRKINTKKELNEKQLYDLSSETINQVLLLPEFKEQSEIKINAFIVRGLKNECFKIAKNLYKHYLESDFKPLFLEEHFGFEEDRMPAVRINGIKLCGVIDRVDVFEDKLRVIDYKTKDAKMTLSEVYYGSKLQLFAYIQAVKALNKQIVGAFYYPITNKFTGEKFSAELRGVFLNDQFVARAFDKNLSCENKRSKLISGLKFNNDGTVFNAGKVLNEKQLESFVDYSYKFMSELISEIKSGDISPLPAVTASGKVCDYCDFCSFSCCINAKIRKLTNVVTKNSFEGEEIISTQGDEDNE